MGQAEEIYSVSRLTRIVRALVESGIPPVWVEGEVSNYTHHRSGHRYFTLKDDKAQLSCVLWRTRAEPAFTLTDGLLVRAYGRITVYEVRGQYQLDVQSLLPAGMGSLQEAYEQLKRKLAGEGLFDAARKKPLPRFPRSVGLVTSPTGAAIHDLVWGFSSRFPPAALYLLPVAVQGEGAAQQIAAALETFNRLGLVDVIVVGRGGGSLEDLWAFNEERVVRAVAASRIPVVSAVGHEVDVTLCDLTADLRAPTPTAAAALVVPDRTELKSTLGDRSKAMRRALVKQVALWRDRLNSLARSYGLQQVTRRLGDDRLRLEELARRMDAGTERILQDSRRQLAAAGLRLGALSPQGVLSRGFCVARRDDGLIVRSSREVEPRTRLNLRFHSGAARTEVLTVQNDQ